VIGIHAPVTGAAPIPQNSFDIGKDVYWKFINEQGGLFKRKVRVVFEDDQFDPRTAVAKCKKMVTEN
jgi:branched-chain amino acid transport system substrate-binding protein